MTASQLITYISWFIYVLVFASALVTAVRRPLRANIDIALLFLMPALIIVIDVVNAVGLVPSNLAVTVSDANGALILAMAYMLLRLVDDFSNVPRWLMRAAEGALAFLIVGVVLLAQSSS